MPLGLIILGNGASAPAAVRALRPHGGPEAALIERAAVAGASSSGEPYLCGRIFLTGVSAGEGTR